MRGWEARRWPGYFREWNQMSMRDLSHDSLEFNQEGLYVFLDNFELSRGAGKIPCTRQHFKLGRGPGKSDSPEIGGRTLEGVGQAFEESHIGGRKRLANFHEHLWAFIRKNLSDFLEELAVSLDALKRGG